jgi:hydroxyacylglutathione hydrolase
MRRIESLRPDGLYPTHFGRMPAKGAIVDSLYRQLDNYVKIADDAGGDLSLIKSGLSKLFEEEAARQGCPCLASPTGRVTNLALDLNASGLALWYGKQNKGAVR